MLLSASSSSAQINQELLVNIRGILFEPLQNVSRGNQRLAEGATLCVINTQNEGPQWFLLNTDSIGVNEQLGSISASLALITSIKASPDGQYLAVVSVGEGHPILEVVNLPQLLQIKSYQVLQTIDPYPGSLEIQEWKDGQLYVKSDVLLTEMDKKSGRVPSEYDLSWQETFALNVISGKITGISEGAKNPVEHYTQILLNQQTSELEKDVALAKLLSLGQGELTLSTLIKLLEQEQNPKRINKLLDQISILRNATK
ncbi:C4-type Zn-finger protein [Candidatus Vecturithrix granuli]|uniref:C4-type Zn-finger protein n=1 Tax=Vecturithrix granuli TaxID=1499967 RepID=A0A081C9W4_VECG1|nr:C4-type Zn-finger protein [Candidatus Vecturithrix granuli]